MKTLGDTTLEKRFTQAFINIEGYVKESVRVKASFGLVVFRGDVTSKAQRLQIVTTALAVMDDVLGVGGRRIVGSPR